MNVFCSHKFKSLWEVQASTACSWLGWMSEIFWSAIADENLSRIDLICDRCTLDKCCFESKYSSKHSRMVLETFRWRYRSRYSRTIERRLGESPVRFLCASKSLNDSEAIVRLTGSRLLRLVPNFWCLSRSLFAAALAESRSLKYNLARFPVFE